MTYVSLRTHQSDSVWFYNCSTKHSWSCLLGPPRQLLQDNVAKNRRNEQQLPYLPETSNCRDFYMFSPYLLDSISSYKSQNTQPMYLVIFWMRIVVHASRRSFKRRWWREWIWKDEDGADYERPRVGTGHCSGFVRVHMCVSEPFSLVSHLNSDAPYRHSIQWKKYHFWSRWDRSIQIRWKKERNKKFFLNII